MTLYIICGFVLTFILSPFAGVWADRYNRKLLIVAADSMIAVATLILAILFYSGYDAMWLFFAIAAVRALGTGIQTPAVGAVLPQIVPSDHLTKVNGVNSSIQSLVTLISPMIAAGLLSVASIEAIMLIDVATAAVAIVILMFFLHIPSHAKAEKAQSVSYVHDLKQGFAYISQHRFLKQFFAFVAILNVMIAPVAFLTPLQVTRTFGAEVWRLSAIEIVFSGGMMRGGLIIAAWGGFRNRTHTIILGITMIGLSTVALGIIPNFWIYLLVMLAAGVMLPLQGEPVSVSP